MSDPKTPEVSDAPPTDKAISAGDKAALKEIGGSNKPEPTRYGDWEVGGICTDF